MGAANGICCSGLRSVDATAMSFSTLKGRGTPRPRGASDVVHGRVPALRIGSSRALKLALAGKVSHRLSHRHEVELSALQAELNRLDETMPRHEWAPDRGDFSASADGSCLPELAPEVVQAQLDSLAAVLASFDDAPAAGAEVAALAADASAAPLAADAPVPDVSVHAGV